MKHIKKSAFRKFSITLVSVACLYNAPSLGSPIFPAEFNGHYYDIVRFDSANTLNRDDSFSDASSRTAVFGGIEMSGHLVTINSSEESNKLHDLLKQEFGSLLRNINLWIDGSWDGKTLGPDTKTAGWRFDSKSDEDFSFSDWKGGEPDHKDEKDKSKDADVASFHYEYSSDSSDWEDNDRHRDDMDGYIIEYEVPEPGTLALVGMGMIFTAASRKQARKSRTTV